MLHTDFATVKRLQIAFIINWILRMFSLQSVFISYLVARSHLYLNFFMIRCDCVGGVNSCCCRSHLHTWSLFASLTKAATFILMTGFFLWETLLSSPSFYSQTEWLSLTWLYKYAVWSCCTRSDICFCAPWRFKITWVNHEWIFTVSG